MRLVIVTSLALVCAIAIDARADAPAPAFEWVVSTDNPKGIVVVPRQHEVSLGEKSGWICSASVRVENRIDTATLWCDDGKTRAQTSASQGYAEAFTPGVRESSPFATLRADILPDGSGSSGQSRPFPLTVVPIGSSPKEWVKCEPCGWAPPAPRQFLGFGALCEVVPGRRGSSPRSSGQRPPS